MDRRTALGKLPPFYAEVIRLRDEGLDDAAVAAALEVDVSAVANVIKLAEAKLSRLMEQPTM